MPRRISVTLERQDEEVVDAFASESSPEHAALAEWAELNGLDPVRLGSDASVVRALLRAGAEGLRERILDSGYAALADSLTREEREESREARSRYMKQADHKMSRV